MTNRKHRKREKRSSDSLLFLILALFVLAAVLLLRTHVEMRQVEVTEPAEKIGSTEEQVSTSPRLEFSGQEEAETADYKADLENAAPVPADSAIRDQSDGQADMRTPYTEETYRLVSDMVFTYRNQQEAGQEGVLRLLDQLKQTDAPLGSMWEKIMQLWSSVNTELVINRDSLPGSLPQDNSLCIIVLGFQLLYDGEMAPELIGRCETALRCLKQYPNAYIAVTGGGTAGGNRTATEADVMADWFISRGVSRDRLIIENRSLTTIENAKNTCRILAESYPEIKTAAMVSSDYHIRLGTLLFQTAAYLYEYENGLLPYVVLAHSAYATPGNDLYEAISMQAQDLWSLADPRI